MATKTLSIILYGPDRELWRSGKATLTVTRLDSHGAAVLKSQELQGAIIEIDLGMHFDAGQVYGIRIQAHRHRPAWQLIHRRTFVREEAGEAFEAAAATLRFMLVPEEPRSPNLVQGLKQFLARADHLFQGSAPPLTSGEGAASEAEEMALLNIESKLRSTTITGDSLMSFVVGIRHVAPDRLFLMVREELKGRVDRSPDWAPAPGHDRPSEWPDLPDHPDSWKHRRYGAGNLQLSFSETIELWPKAEEGPSYPCYSVDADIDLARGVKHVAEWLDNNVFHPGQKTDQGHVYALLFSQGVLPDYTISPVQA